MSKVIVIDLEMNKPSGKIIQLGYVIGNVRKSEVIKSVNINVNPGEPIDPYITDLTGINQADADSGLSLMEAYGIMCADIKRHNPTTTCVQWGSGDSYYLKKELGLSSEEYIFRTRVFDVKALFQMQQMFLNKSVAMGLGSACKEMGIEFEGTAHNALADATNTFKIFCDLGHTMALSTKMRKLVNG